MKRVITVILLFISFNTMAESSSQDFLKEAISHIDSKNYQKALIACNKAVVLDSTSVTAWYLRGYIKYKLENYDAAIEDLSKSIELDKEYLEAYYYRGLCRNQNGNFWGAYRDLNKASDIAPVDSRVVVLKGIVKKIIT